MLFSRIKVSDISCWRRETAEITPTHGQHRIITYGATSYRVAYRGLKKKPTRNPTINMTIRNTKKVTVIIGKSRQSPIPLRILTCLGC